MNGNVYTHGFLVDNINDSIRFYESHFGFSVERRTETFAQMKTDSPTGLFFWQYDHLVKHLGQEAMKNVRHKQMMAMLFDKKEQVDARVQELRQEGVVVVAAPQVWPWNAYAAYFVDPNGFLWELWAKI